MYHKPVSPSFVGWNIRTGSGKPTERKTMCGCHYVGSKYCLIWIKEEKSKKCSLICNCFSGIFLRTPEQKRRFLIKSCTFAAQPSTELPPTLGSARKDVCYRPKANTRRKASAAYIQCSGRSGKLARPPLPKCLGLGTPNTAPRSKAAQGTPLPLRRANLTQPVKLSSPFTDTGFLGCSQTRCLGRN